MRAATVFPGKLKGGLEVPTSKSQTHRAILCAAMAEGVSTVRRVVLSDDILATLAAARAFGAQVSRIGNGTGEGLADFMISGSVPLRGGEEVVDCRESGSTLRFAVPLALTTGERFTFEGKGKLPERPMEAYYALFRRQGIPFETDAGRLPLRVQGKLEPDVFTLPGNVSSQFVTGLLLAMPLLAGPSEIRIDGTLESGNYVDMTLRTQADFGVRIDRTGYSRFASVPQAYSPAQVVMEGDYSQAAFWMVGGALGAGVGLKGLRPESLQGDRASVALLRTMGVRIEQGDGPLEVSAGKLSGMTMDASDCPDIVPIMAVAGAFAEGTTRIVNARRLRYKESDRLMATARELGKLGASILETEDGLVVSGRSSLEGGVAVWSHGDHRIAMSLAVAATRCRRPVVIEGMEAIEKSYPNFVKDFKKMGGRIHERDLG